MIADRLQRRAGEGHAARRRARRRAEWDLEDLGRRLDVEGSSARAIGQREVGVVRSVAIEIERERVRRGVVLGPRGRIEPRRIDHVRIDHVRIGKRDRRIDRARVSVLAPGIVGSTLGLARADRGAQNDDARARCLRSRRQGRGHRVRSDRVSEGGSPRSDRPPRGSRSPGTRGAAARCGSRAAPRPSCAGCSDRCSDRRAAR